MDTATRKRLFNLCNPNEPLEPGDARYVDVDSIPGDVRGGHFVERLAHRIELSDAPVTSFVTAQRGTGLTTELRRLGQRLGMKGHGNHFVVFVEAADFIELSSPLHAADLLLGIWANTEQVLASTLGKPISQHMSRFLWWLNQTDVQVKGVYPEIAFARNASIKDGMRRRFASDRGRVIDEIRNELYVRQDELKTAGYDGLVVIVDGLNGLQGFTTNARDVLDSAERVFSAEITRWRLPIHIVWTVPSGLMLRPSMHIDVLPSITIEHPWGHTWEPGLATLERIVYARIPPLEFIELLGDMSWRERFTALVNVSCGNIRDLLRLLRECLLVDRLDDSAFRGVYALFADSWRRVVTRDMLRQLRDVHSTKSLAQMDLVSAEDAVAWRFVVRNEPGGTYEVHPALHEMLPSRGK